MSAPVDGGTPAPAVPVLPAPWPYGPGRPGMATAAAWLGLCSAGVAVLMAAVAGYTAVILDDWAADLLLGVLGLPAAIVLVVGAHRLATRRGRGVLMGGSLLAGFALAGPAVATAEADLAGVLGVLGWAWIVLPLPVLTLVYATRARVVGWLRGAPAPPGELPYAPPPPGWAPEHWPYGPPRPAPATTASVLGIVAAGLTLAFVPGTFLMNAMEFDYPAFETVLLLGVPCAAGMIAGAVALIRRRSRDLLLRSAAGAALVLLAALPVGLLTHPDPYWPLMFVGLALPLPVLAALYARRREVTDWLTGR